MPVDLSLLDLAPVQPREAPVSFTYERWVAAGKPCLRQSCGHPHAVPPGVDHGADRRRPPDCRKQRDVEAALRRASTAAFIANTAHFQLATIVEANTPWRM